jgi:hypothetical protein
LRHFERAAGLGLSLLLRGSKESIRKGVDLFHTWEDSSGLGCPTCEAHAYSRFMGLDRRLEMAIVDGWKELP